MSKDIYDNMIIDINDVKRLLNRYLHFKNMIIW